MIPGLSCVFDLICFPKPNLDWNRKLRDSSGVNFSGDGQEELSLCSTHSTAVSTAMKILVWKGSIRSNASAQYRQSSISTLPALQQQCRQSGQGAGRDVHLVLRPNTARGVCRSSQARCYCCTGYL